MKRGALVLLLASAVVSGAEAQSIPTGATPSCKVVGGSFTLTGGPATFHLALDDHRFEQSAFVVMRFIDQNGTVVRSRTVNLDAGATVSLEYRGTGLYRVQAEVFELPGPFSDRRTVVGSVEVPPTVPPIPVVEPILVLGGRWQIPCEAYKLP
jgi:hypothetical protein